MTASKPPKSKLTSALRANLRLRRAQQQRREAEQADSAVEPATGLRYSGFAVRERSQVAED